MDSDGTDSAVSAGTTTPDVFRFTTPGFPLYVLVWKYSSSITVPSFVFSEHMATFTPSFRIGTPMMEMVILFCCPLFH